MIVLTLLTPAHALASAPWREPGPADDVATDPRITGDAAPSSDPGPAGEPTSRATAPASATVEPALDPNTRNRRSWATCDYGTIPCTRSRPARTLLLALGVAGGAIAAGLLFGLGDRLVDSDPATLLVGASALAGAGAIVGAIAGRLGADGPGAPDRLRPPTLSLAQSYTGPTILDETPGHTLLLRMAPNIYLPQGDARLRLFGHLGGWLLPVRDVDPRPQFTEVPAGQEGTAPRVLRQRRLSVGLGIDLAVALPYPVLAPRRSARLGRAELRYRPEVQIRRDSFAPGTSQATILSRTMLLPLTVGMRWHLSPRQRFTMYVGPRFDFVGFSDRGSTSVRRGGAQLGPLYGEAWYDIDVPLTGRPRADRQPRRLTATGQITLGYIHSRFDGQGLNVGPVIGFLGPIHVGWSTRLRPVGARLAAQLGAYARIGTGSSTAVGLELGLVAPDLRVRGRATR